MDPILVSCKNALSFFTTYDEGPVLVFGDRRDSRKRSTFYDKFFLFKRIHGF